MGCSESRNQIPVPRDLWKEEEILSEHEHCLPFNEIPAADIVAAIHSETKDEFIDEDGLERILDKLDISTVRDSSTFQRILNELKTEDGHFPVRKLAVLAILAGKGTSSHKSKVAFRLYSKQVKGYLSKQEVHDLVMDLITLTFVVIPKASTGSSKNQLNQTELKEYVGPAILETQSLASKVTDMISTGAQVSKAEFDHRLSDECYLTGNILSSVNFRILCIHLLRPNE